MNNQKFDADQPDLKAVGYAVARLKRPPVPSGLLARTLDKIAASAPVRRTVWLLRPITNPLARTAAAAAIVLALFPLTDLDVAETIGPRLESRVVGPVMVDHFEGLVDGVLRRVSHEDYSQSELDAFIAVPAASQHLRIKAKTSKLAHTRSHV